MKFRKLEASEIECRLSIVNEYGAGILLYKDARCDQNILDETVGEMNWQRHHNRDNANCIVSIWDESKKQWIEKEDTGTESYTEKEKGLASDSFKRACFNWGIGRELYTAPDMFIKGQNLNKHERNVAGKWICKDAFYVDHIEYFENSISYVRIVSKKTGKAFEFGTPAKEAAKQKEVANECIDEAKKTVLRNLAKEKGISIVDVEKRYGAVENMTVENWMKAMSALKNTKGN